MLYEIKFLKAPWPKGAKVGDVVDMPYLPDWAQGKCSIALDGATATIEFPEPVAADGVNRPLVGDGTGSALPGTEAIHAEVADLRAKLAAADNEKVRLMGELDAATGAHEGTASARDAAVAEAADLRAKLAAAEQAANDAASTAGSKGKQR